MSEENLYLHSLDPAEREVLEASVGWTMCSPLQRHFIIDSVRYIANSGIRGDIVECGVWRGGMMQIAAKIALARFAQQHFLPGLWLFDTFEGMPEPESDRDRDMYNGVHASDHLARSPRIGANNEPTVWCYADIDDVRAGMSLTGYPENLIHLVPGKVEATIPKRGPEAIALLRIDTDWESSTRHVLESFFDRVVPGGVIAFDDYESWAGARFAVDDFFASRDLVPLLIRLDKGRVYIK